MAEIVSRRNKTNREFDPDPTGIWCQNVVAMLFFNVIITFIRRRWNQFRLFTCKFIENLFHHLFVYTVYTKNFFEQ
jgi:hypothetical protein